MNATPATPVTSGTSDISGGTGSPGLPTLSGGTGSSGSPAPSGGPGGLTLRELHSIEEFEDAFGLFDAIWRPDPGAAPVSVEMMRALSHAGNYVAGAYLDGRLAGASVGFLAAPAGQVLHSHVTGATTGRGIGLALKLHQRAWALERGLDRITWTYDPLVRRNAHFNLVKLGALPEEYLPSFYGVMEDAINAGDESDRVLAVWRLTEPHVLAAAGGRPHLPRVPADAVVGLGERDGHPVAGRTDAATVLVTVPGDVEALRRGDPGAAASWRRAVRDVLGGLLAEGARVTGFHDRSCYVLSCRPDGDGTEGRRGAGRRP
ncbi:GNAT family N-acetyltransferase [Streptosporangium sp. NPDC050855]|uniref:GNAT family N-acetyltransferase n=1 Tax=Streptosporangium sp. NPDC050855 TaxID=3366194 RepID=UPI0037956736